ncbi:MAG: sugar ABC transporter ATP-binding protein, partial [Mesorhizobium sp.]
LEGQGQDELFAALAGSIRPSGGTIEVDGQAVKFSHPIDAIRAGIAYVPGDRSEALAMQRSVRENIALPFSAALRNWGPIHMRKERATVASAIQRLQIDTRAQGEVQRLSGGNQQKVILGRWLSEQGVRVLIVDEPTRGIDVGAKSEIYELLYQLAEDGMAIVVVSSDLPEVMGICDRILVMCGGRINAELARNQFAEKAILAAALPDTKTPDAIAS